MKTFKFDYAFLGIALEMNASICFLAEKAVKEIEEYDSLGDLSFYSNRIFKSEASPSQLISFLI